MANQSAQPVGPGYRVIVDEGEDVPSRGTHPCLDGRKHSRFVHDHLDEIAVFHPCEQSLGSATSPVRRTTMVCAGGRDCRASPSRHRLR